MTDGFTEDNIIEIDGTVARDEPTWETGLGLDGIGKDIELDLRPATTIRYDGPDGLFWEHVGTWGRVVMNALRPSYGVIVTASNLRSTRTPWRESRRKGEKGETEFGSIASSLGKLGGDPFMTMHGFPRSMSDGLAFDMSFACPDVTIMTQDMPLRDWVAETLAKPTEELRHMRYATDGSN